MTAEGPPRTILSSRLRLVLMEGPVIEALLEGRREDATRLLGASIPGSWPADDDLWLLRIRLDDIAREPANEAWFLRAIVRADDGALVGHAGFHGPPDKDGIVEIAYTTLAAARRRGYAEEAARALLEWAAHEHGITRARASVGPENGASLALVRKLGFRKIGMQWDERDGEEIVFELDLRQS